ncbi:FAD-dependent oxidoreductase [Corallococcus sp. RDP092CA]|uniref:FAD-dependent oxidoreductase n=1 Tax=Corallococcus sp. RDP092CA TaxID=3109369 RepID=UPI0035AEEECB
MTSHSPSTQSTPVLIVGGGIAGLSAALFLAWRGVPCVLAERHPGSSPHPRAIGFTTRTLEQFRAVGLGDKIPQIPFGHGRPRRVAVESLAGRWSAEVDWSPDAGQAAASQPRANGLRRLAGAGRPSPTNEPLRPESYSPCAGAAIAQDRLEPILRDRAIELGADIRLNTQLISFEQDAAGVTAVLRHRDGREQALRAGYLIAADGHASPIREALGIGRAGHGVLQVVRSVLFRASLDEYLESGVSQFELDQPDLKGMLTTYRDGRWLLMFTDDEERDEATLRKKVVQAVGKPDLAFELITTGRWVLSALIADRFSSGRVFLVGDAAHTLPPARGGYGANTGVEDSFNLAWKLASVIAGVSSARLLDTYDAERRPIAWLRHGQIFARRDYAKWATDAEKAVAIIDDDAMELGQLYRSEAVLGAGDELPPALRPEQWAGQPGTRAPHLWVSHGGMQRSTLDLLQRDWVLVSESERWCAAAARASEDLGIELKCLHFGAGTTGSGTTVSPPTVGTNKLTLDTPVEQIVAIAEGRAVLDANLPMITTHSKYETFKSMSLRQLQPVSDGKLSDAALVKTETLLAAVPCQAVPMDAAVFRNDFRAAFGLGPSGASLVRPDGYVAWRSSRLPDDPAAAIAAALTQLAATSRS